MDVKQRRRLTDLYARGEETDLAPEGQEPFVVWVRKMTPADAEVAYLKASARRAAVLALGKEDPPSDLFLTLKGEVDLLSRDSLVLWVAASDMSDRRPLIEARLAGEEEWSKERYLISLQERFSDDDFVRKVEELPDDPEVVRVLAELERFQAQVSVEEVEVQRQAEADAEELPTEELQKRVLDAMVAAHGDAAWLAEFQSCQVWRCVFEADDHSKPLFGSRVEVEGEQVEVIQRLKEVIDRIHVSDAETKGLEETPVSLPLSV